MLKKYFVFIFSVCLLPNDPRSGIGPQPGGWRPLFWHIHLNMTTTRHQQPIAVWDYLGHHHFIFWEVLTTTQQWVEDLRILLFSVKKHCCVNSFQVSPPLSLPWRWKTKGSIASSIFSSCVLATGFSSSVFFSCFSSVLPLPQLLSTH